ncbi:hypothetical protein A3B32_02425 [Candidatus Uhrbacteria bacterium RIFCSPLOWO2_01_FULL_53_9]|uniref:HTH merR-type domain-containing protein n=2 Tax=Candidatus Uhriibacteriota TaxID=1752732 RepID=A0A1F7UYQ4_9BACT|nr:MAG: hypothetical protein A3C17_00915 [Candidatus Uhrbacteria bacterium RIFCSPHIGHO2_02_FULL_53_13]OGL83392.1 MAG: hypothetical protein A3B32_02425 [Candidatus Uhrbacteria bacterium RIFCSPLOWO2_01_FULL_53_9]
METSDKKIRIGEAAKILGVSVQTLRNWEKSGKLHAERSSGQQRYYSLTRLKLFVLDIQKLGHAWAVSAFPPDLPREFYCERPDRFTSRVAGMGFELQQSGRLSEDLVSLVTLVAGEVGDNSFAHNVGNWLDIPGVFYAYNVGKRLIVLADRGRGVKTTLQQARPRISSDVEALTTAFTEIISGRSPEKRGNGLKVVRKIMESNQIGLLFQSGVGMVIIPKKPGTMRVKMSDEFIRGTFAVISF